MRPSTWMRMLVAAVVASVVAACASIGRPEGGPRDETPPVFVRSVPEVSQLNVEKSRLDLWFDENIKVEDALNKVVVSPAQKTPPSVFANGKHLRVELRDSLLPNTTYTIDFADAIRDLNEGNILDGLAVDFSTGPTIDTLRISGMVLEGRTLEPAQGMLVGVYSNLSDTALTTLPFERIAKTNQLGQFTIRNLPAGEYRLFAVNDVNRDNHWDRSEDVAFYDLTVSPVARNFEVVDTLAAADGSDSLSLRPGVEYLPNDLLLTWFNEDYKSQYLKDYKRIEPKKLRVEFATRSDSLPQLTIVNGPNQGRSIADLATLEASLGRDTLVYWLRDSAVIAQDSLLIAMRYLRTDTLDKLSWSTDTLRFFNPVQTISKKKADQKKKDDEDKKNQKKHKGKEEADTAAVDSVAPEIPMLGLKLLSGSVQELSQPMLLEVDMPLQRLDTAAVRLYQMVDTIWTAVSDQRFYPDSASIMRFYVDSEWKPDQRYKLEIDSLAMVGIYDLANGPFSQEVRTKKLEDYGSLVFNLKGLPDSAAVVVELLNGSDKPVMTAPVEGSEAAFSFVKPGAYYARLYIDANRNGQWDTGNVADKLQPEEVSYFSKKINVKQNWDIAQDWDVAETPVDLQKPLEIKKNKPKTKGRDKSGIGTGDDDEEDDGLYDPFNPGGNSWGNGSQYDNYNRYNPNMHQNRGNQLAR